MFSKDPKQGFMYRIKKGDWLSTISQIAYGDMTKWRIIYDANQNRLKSSNPDLIYPNEVVYIPKLNDIESKMTGKEKGEGTFILGGDEIDFISATITTSINALEDGCVIQIPFDRSDEKLKKKVFPFSYTDMKFYIGNELVISGRLYEANPKTDGTGETLTLKCYSYTADLVDSTLKPPYERNNMTLENYAKIVCSPITVENNGAKKLFKRITATKEDTIFSSMLKIAKQESVLLTCGAKGTVIISKANTETPKVILEKGDFQYLGAGFDGRKKFASYRVNATTPKKTNGYAVAKDETVPLARFRSFSVGETQGGLQDSANWERSKAVADALTFPISYAGLYNPKGKLWKTNTGLTLKSDLIFLKDGFDFLIKSVVYKYTPDKRSVELSCVTPQVYTGEEIPKVFSI